ncbi:MAG: hypothetical protein QOH63_1959 [Acidobacteriota bacterium]|jgi:hypothetical protein|nr:hypothetical protein [Acidobacteriota bacterium]
MPETETDIFERQAKLFIVIEELKNDLDSLNKRAVRIAEEAQRVGEDYEKLKGK